MRIIYNTEDRIAQFFHCVGELKKCSVNLKGSEYIFDYSGRMTSLYSNEIVSRWKILSRELQIFKYLLLERNAWKNYPDRFAG